MRYNGKFLKNPDLSDSFHGTSHIIENSMEMVRNIFQVLKEEKIQNIYQYNSVFLFSFSGFIPLSFDPGRCPLHSLSPHQAERRLRHEGGERHGSHRSIRYGFHV